VHIKYTFSILIFALCCWTATISYAQIEPNLGQTDQWMKAAKAAMERNDYQTANSIFRDLIDSGRSLPEEMPYFFAETLYHVGQYDNSSNFLNKYLSLTGFTGQYYEDASALQEKLRKPLAAIQTCHLCDRRGYRYKTCFTCDGKKEIEQVCSYCKGKGVVGCSKCSGSGMITKVNVFNIVEYYQCERCEGNGRLTCPVCQGSLKEVSACRTCQGTGKLSSEDLCDHHVEVISMP